METPEFYRISVYTTDGSHTEHRFEAGDTPDARAHVYHTIAGYIAQAADAPDGMLVLSEPFAAYRISQITKIVWEDGVTPVEQVGIGFIR